MRRVVCVQLAEAEAQGTAAPKPADLRSRGRAEDNGGEEMKVDMGVLDRSGGRKARRQGSTQTAMARKQEEASGGEQDAHLMSSATTTPPKNALLLMCCRSVPQNHMLLLTSRFPAVGPAPSQTREALTAMASTRKCRRT